MLPALLSAQVSLSVAPAIPKLAVAIDGGSTDTVADIDAPPYDPVIVLVIVPPTVLVNAEKVALVVPTSTVTLGGSVSGSVPVSVTTAPPAGAGPVRLAVPNTDSPPVTVLLVNVIAASVTRLVTVSAAD